MTKTFCSLSALIAASIVVIQADAKEDLSQAIKKLADGGGYTWKSTSESAQFNMGPTLGKIDQDGCALVSRTWGDNTIRSVHTGDQAATETQDGWRSLADLEADQGDNRGRFRARMLSSFRPPAEEAEAMLKGSSGLALSDGVYRAELKEETVKDLISFSGRGGGAPGMSINNANGSAKFWVEQGRLSKYQYTVRGTMNWNNQDRDIDRTTTVEISEVGTTKVEVPEAAKAKLKGRQQHENP